MVALYSIKYPAHASMFFLIHMSQTAEAKAEWEKAQGQLWATTIPNGRRRRFAISC